MRTGLFKKIWIKHLQKGIELRKLSEDVGELKGVFSYIGMDVKTGQILKTCTEHNMIVNQSKSTIIRLLGQGSSIYSGAIDPAKFKISRMRFSNDTGGTDLIRGLVGPNKLEYYSMTEASNRISYPVDGIFGGGLKSNSVCAPPINPSEEEYKHDFTGNNVKQFNNIPNDATGYKAVTGGKVFDLKSGDRSVSHGTVIVRYYKNFGAGEKLIEEHLFDLKVGTGINEGVKSIYTRDSFKNRPHRIKNYQVNGNFYYISTPVSAGTNFATTTESGVQVRTTTISESGANLTNTRIFYDYTIGKQGWKIYLEELQLTQSQLDAITKYNQNGSAKISAGNNYDVGNNVWDTIQISFTLGYYNVINLIVPRYGYNNGYGTTDLIRYGNQNGDFYPTVTPTYQDCDSDYIDDYAVTFTTSMNANEGNGIGGQGDDVIKYKKAYLFTENNEMFSSIVLPTESVFEKNSNSAFQVTWKILAPIN